MEKEVDKDLTMIQPDKSSTDLSFEEMVKKAPKSAVSSLSPEIKNRTQLNAYMEDQQNKFLVDRSMESGVVDPKLDANRSLLEDTNSVRARNQSGFVKGVKAIGGGLVQGGLIALEQAGYVADIDTYLNLFKDVEDLSGNWWTNLMRDAQEGLRETDAFKIYEQTPDQNSIMSQIFKWSSLEGAVSSAVGFGISGLGAAKLVSFLGSTKKFAQLGDFVDVTLGNIGKNKAAQKALTAGLGNAAAAQQGAKAAAAMKGYTQAFVGPLASSMMSNYFMGQLMAVDTYNQSMEELKPLIDSGEIDAFEAQKLSSNEAQDVVGLNMLLTATAYIKFNNIFKRPNRIKGLVENPSAMNQMKNLIKAGSPTAFTENVYQEMIQMEQLYDVRKALGEPVKYSEDPWDRMTQLALSERALHAGALGVVGGPIQFAIIQRPLMGKQIKEQRKIYDAQQKRLNWHEQFIANNLDNFTKYEDSFNKAVVDGKLNEAELFNDMGLIEEVANAVEWGTLGAFKNDVEKIAKMDEDAATKEGYSEGHQEKAQRLLEVLNKTEGYVAKMGGLVNTAEAVRNALFSDRVLQEMGEQYKQLGELQKKVAETLTMRFPDAELVFDPLSNKISYARDPKRFESMTEADKVKQKRLEEAENKALKSAMDYNKDYHELKDVSASIKKLDKFAEDLNKKFQEIISPEYQENYTAKQEANIKAAQKMVKDQGDKLVKGEEDAPAKFTTEAKVRKENPLTQEEIDAKIETWDDSPVTKKHSIKESTFSSKDKDRDVRLYTPGELLRSKDGRTFRVLAQNTRSRNGVKEQAHKRGPNMPVIQEVTEEGKTIEGAKPLVLESHEFLRPESRQPIMKRSGKKGFGYEDVWGTYVKTDSLLKPNNLSYQLSLVDMAQRAEVSGLNVPADVYKRNDLEWLDNYAHQELNLPFKGKEPVTFKLRQEGPTEVYVDVYKKVNGEEVLLTRINREGNINYTAITDLLVANNGKLTGEKVGHYSSSTNLLKQYDDNGNKVYYELKDFANINPEYLINGKLWLAQSRGENNYLNPPVARALDGELVTENVIFDSKTGEAYDIPKMGVGDTYALILSPGRKITPIALSAKNLEDIPSSISEGGTFTTDLVSEWQEAINNWTDDYFGDQSELNSKLSREIGADPKVAEVDYARELRNRKDNKLWELRKDPKTKTEYDAVSSVVAKHIRLNWNKHSELGELDGETIYDQNSKGKKIVRRNYFDVTVVASEKTGNWVPAIQMYNERNSTRSKTINLDDHREEFMEVLGGKRKKVAISTLADTEGDGKAIMKNILENDGLVVDVDYKNPFVGSSATFTIDGDDFKALSTDVANRKETKITKQFKKVIKEDKKLEKLTEEAFKERQEELEDRIVDIINQEENEWLGEVAYSESAEEVQLAFSTLVDSFDFTNSRDAQKVLADTFAMSEEDLGESYTETLEGVKERGLDNAEAITKGIMALAFLNESVKAGDIGLSKLRVLSNSDAGGKHTQPEGLKFEFGNSVYNTEYGEGKFKAHVKNDMYKIILNRGKEVIVYPGDTYRANGTRHKLAQINKELSKLSKETPQYASALSRQTRLQNKLISEMGKSEEVASPETNTETLYDAFTGVDAVTGLKDAVKDLGTSERASAISAGLTTLKAIEDANGKGIYPITPELAKNVSEAILSSIPYTQKQLLSLIDIADDNINRGIDYAENMRAKASFLSLQNIRKVLEGKEDYSNAFSATLYRFNKTRNELLSFESPMIAPRVSQGKGSTAKASTPFILAVTHKVIKALSESAVAETRLKANLFTKVEAKPEVEPSKKENDETATAEKETPTTVRKKVRTVEATTIDPKEDVDAWFESLSPPVLAKLAWEQALIFDKNDFAEAYQDLTDAEVDTNPLFEEFVEKIKPVPGEDGIPFKSGDAVTSSPEEFQAEVNAISELLPQVPVEVVDSVAKMVKRYGKRAIGAFDSGVRVLVRNAQKGTGYHETFHAVADLYLTTKEKTAIAKEQGYDSWSAKLEEKLADDFADHVKNKPARKGNLVQRFFRAILDWFRNTRSADVTTKVFDKIANKGYAKSKSLNWQSGISPLFNSINEYKASLSRKNKVLLQELLDANKIEIVC